MASLGKAEDLTGDERGQMKTFAIVCLAMVAVWWLVLTIWVVGCHRDRVRLAANWTPENEKEYQMLEAREPRFLAGFRERLVLMPFMVFFVLLLLPCYIHHWLVPDPFKRPDKSN